MMILVEEAFSLYKSRSGIERSLGTIFYHRSDGQYRATEAKMYDTSLGSFSIMVLLNKIVTESLEVDGKSSKRGSAAQSKQCSASAVYSSSNDLVGSSVHVHLGEQGDLLFQLAKLKAHDVFPSDTKSRDIRHGFGISGTTLPPTCTLLYS